MPVRKSRRRSSQTCCGNSPTRRVHTGPAQAPSPLRHRHRARRRGRAAGRRVHADRTSARPDHAVGERQHVPCTRSSSGRNRRPHSSLVDAGSSRTSRPPPRELILQHATKTRGPPPSPSTPPGPRPARHRPRRRSPAPRLRPHQKRVAPRQTTERSELVSTDQHLPRPVRRPPELLDPARRVGLVRQPDLDVLRVAGYAASAARLARGRAAISTTAAPSMPAAAPALRPPRQLADARLRGSADSGPGISRSCDGSAAAKRLRTTPSARIPRPPARRPRRPGLLLRGRHTPAGELRSPPPTRKTSEPRFRTR